MGADGEAQVVLNVYDLTDVNSYTYWFGFGIFHSGIEVHGKEYGFGAHEFSASGVFEVEPRSCPGFIYRCSIQLGRVNMLPTEFRTFIENMASEYHGDTYHLISKNCNHFTDDLARRLTGKGIPGWVNRLAGLGRTPVPFFFPEDTSISSCLLPESLQVTTVKQSPVYHDNSEEDGFESLSSAPQTEIDDNEPEQHLLPSPTASSEVSFVKESRM